MDHGSTPPPAVLARYAGFAGAPCRAISIGLINRTFVVDGARGRAVVQELHPIFGAAVNEDIDAVTAHLARKGLATPRPIRTDDGALSVLHEGRVWRALTFVDGHSIEKLSTTDQAHAAGALVGRFHRAVADLAHDYRFTRAGVHDLGAHLATLARALDDRRDHPSHADVAALAAPLVRRAAEFPDVGALPLRHVHGDLKVSNILFDDEGRGVCLVDLDTLGRMPWPFEMGDALRSWTNPRREDERPASVDHALFRAAVEGYASTARDVPSAAERAALVVGVEMIALELAVRFLADALHERYFGWDAARYPSRGAHNLARGRAMAELSSSVAAGRAALERIVDEAFA